MSEVTVAITTTGRPKFLRTALQSVQNQVDREIIGEVIVSENKAERRTEEIVREFPELPIRYLFREPTLPMVAHFFSTVRQARTPYLAILNDDDWWFSNHLSEAVSALRLRASYSAYVSASLWLKDEADISPWGIMRSSALWLLAGKPPWLQLWTIDGPSMLALNWLYCPFHWSTLVGRTAALHEVLDVLEKVTYSARRDSQDDSFQRVTVDRFMFNHLALRGALCYNPVPDTFVRSHAENWVKDKDPNKISEMLRSATALTKRLANEHGWDVQKIWANALVKMPAEFKPELLDRFHEAHTDQDLRRYGFERFFHAHRPRRRAKALHNILVNAKRFVLGR